MRAAHVIVVSALATGGLALVFAFDRSPPLPFAAAPPQPSTTAAPAGLPARSPFAARGTAAGSATTGLACIQEALGGVTAFAGVSSIRITGHTKAAASSGMRPLPNNREIRAVFPDHYSRTDVETAPPKGLSAMTSVVGFSRRVPLSKPGGPDVTATLRSAQREFVREMLMRLPRQFGDVRLSQRMGGSPPQQLTIAAFGPDGLDGTLLADARTCVPLALLYQTGSFTYRIDLSGYRPFGNIRFPTVLKTTRNGQAWMEEYDSDIQVNPPDAEAYFATAGQ